MTGSELATAPRERFAERFALLYAEAGNPPLKRVTESVQRARELDEQGRPVRVPGQRISDWRRGRNVPAKFAGLAAVLRVLIGEARKRRADPVLDGLYDLDAWQRLWQQALASPIAAVPSDDAETPEPAEPAEPAALGEPEPAVCPYRGLAAFRQSDTGWFFGRERSTQQLVGRLRQASVLGGFVVLVGASGAGKSSLLRAGLGPSLPVGSVSSAQTVPWPVVTVTPGRAPLAELAEAIPQLAAPLQAARAALDDGADPATERFAAEVRSAVRAYAGGQGSGVVLVVDQLEELFTLTSDEDVRLLFLRALHAVCTPSAGFRGEPAPGRVVLGVRADFYDRCLGYPEIVDATQGRQLALGAMTAQGLSDAVLRPAKAVGLQLERGLVDLMLADLGARVHGVRGRVAGSYDAGALPLLSHALLATWQRRSGGKLTIAGYRAAGGIHGAVAATAERTWESLDGPQQAAARRILLHLVQVGDTTRDVRRRSSRSELIAGEPAVVRATERALEVLAAARLVTLDADAVEISHEALLEAWPRLRSWIDDDRAENLLRQRLESDALVWDAQQRDPSLLYRGVRLASTAQAIGTTSVARDFLAASARGARRTRWLRRASVALVCVLALTAVTAAAIAIDQRDEAEFQRIVTESDTLLATDPSLAAQLALVAHAERPDDAAVNGRLLSMQHAPLATPLRGHRAAVYLTSFSPDGQLLATASEDKTVRLWRVPADGKPTPLGKPLTGHTGWVGSAVFSPDGRTLASAGDDGTVRLWNVADPAHPKSFGKPLGGANGRISLVAFSPDGTTLATANGDGTVGLWDVADPAHAEPAGRPLTGHRGAVRSVAFSADGSKLASGSDDTTVRLWDVRRPERAKQLGEPLSEAEDIVHSVAFSPDGRTLAAGVEDTTVRLWNVADPERPQAYDVPLGHEGLVWSVAFSPDGRTLASGSADGTTRLWNVADPAHPASLSRPLTARTGIVYAVAFSPDGTRLATGSDDNVARLWSLPEGLVAAHPEGAAAVAISPDGRTVASGGADRAGQLWRLSAGRLELLGKPLRGAKGVVHQLDIGPDGDLLVMGSPEGKVRLWRLDDLGHAERVGPELPGGAGYLSPDGDLLALLDGQDLRFYDVSNPERPRAEGEVDTGHTNYLTSGAFSPDGRTFVAGSFDTTASRWDVSDPEAPARVGEPLAGHSGPVWAVAVSPDGQVVATASGDRTVRLWDARTGAARGEPLRGHSDTVNALAFGPHGSRLVTGGYDGSLRLWDLHADDGPTSTELTGHTSLVEDVAVTPDGRTVVSASGDGTVRAWRLDAGSSIERICRHSRGVLTPEAWARYVPQRDYQPPC